MQRCYTLWLIDVKQQIQYQWAFVVFACTFHIISVSAPEVFSGNHWLPPIPVHNDNHRAKVWNMDTCSIFDFVATLVFIQIHMIVVHNAAAHRNSSNSLLFGLPQEVQSLTVIALGVIVLNGVAVNRLCAVPSVFTLASVVLRGCVQSQSCVQPCSLGSQLVDLSPVERFDSLLDPTSRSRKIPVS